MENRRQLTTLALRAGGTLIIHIPTDEVHHDHELYNDISRVILLWVFQPTGDRKVLKWPYGAPVTRRLCLNLMALACPYNHSAISNSLSITGDRYLNSD